MARPSLSLLLHVRSRAAPRTARQDHSPSPPGWRRQTVRTQASRRLALLYDQPQRECMGIRWRTRQGAPRLRPSLFSNDTGSGGACLSAGWKGKIRHQASQRIRLGPSRHKREYNDRRNKNPDGD